MASTLLICLILMTSIVIEAMAASTQGHFPLEDCLKDDIDILWLMDYDIDDTWKQQLNLIYNFDIELLDMRSPLKVARVLDQFSAHNEIIDVRDWSFRAPVKYEQPRIIRKTETVVEPIRYFRTRLEIKIQFVDDLFAEMNGVRNNATHVGVVFLDGKSLTQEEIRNVPSIVQQHSADEKIFVVIFGSKLVEEIVHLTDTVVLPNGALSYFDQHLLMAMCKMCGSSGTLFEHTTGLNMLSCFITFRDEYEKQKTWSETLTDCIRYYNGYLAGIETEEKLPFLKELLNEKIKAWNISHDKYYIGLRRDLSNYAKRFQWMTNQGRYRPLLTNHWLPGQPCIECRNFDCVVWKFTSTWSRDNDSSNIIQNITYDEITPNDGWENVNCNSRVESTFLCEVVLPRRIEDVDFNFTIPTPTISTNFRVDNEHFLIYDKNIVSVSANVLNPDFLRFLKNSNLDFPIFDCGEDAVELRYISYNRVCDFVDHCNNKRDELLCVNPLKSTNYVLYLEKTNPSDNKRYCTSGQRLYSNDYWCDNVKDCVDGSDEENCLNNECKSVRCLDESCLPLQWVNDGVFDCFIYPNSSYECIISDESSQTGLHLLNNKSCALVCNRDKCIEESHLKDSLIDCKGPEGRLAKTIANLEPANACENSLGYSIWAPKCHYIKDRYGGIVGCRDMSHLRDCENFRCGPGYVKCYNSYCIPDYYLRDGKADCPTGEDEQLFYTGPCTGRFACWDSNICLHPDLVCDGHPDCPHDDDELDCNVYCPEGFRCIAGTISVLNYNSSVPLDLSSVSGIDPRTRYLDLSGVVIYNFYEFVYMNMEVFLNLKVLILSNCNIIHLDVSYIDNGNINFSPFVIQKLDISYNAFQIFSDHKYYNIYKHLYYLNLSHNRQLKSVTNLRFTFLEILDLSYTSIFYLNDSVFANLPKLKHLNLSHTLISDFTRQYFSTNPTLQTLDLRGIRTEDLDDFLFHGLTISQALYTDHFQICCPQIHGLKIKPHACIALLDVDAVSSCFNLLGLDIQRFLLWIVAILAVLGNVTVIVYRVMWDRSVLQTGYGLFVTNLGISDFIMGVYLFIIAGADYFYRDNYVFYDKNWRNSVVCKIAGFMACLSCEASTFFVFLITLDRFLVIKFPFGLVKLTGFHKTIAVMMSWVASFILSLVPIVFNFDIYSSNAMCLGLPLTNTQAKGWGYSVGIFIIYNLIMFFFIACGQYAIFRAMTQTRMANTATSMASTRRAKEITVAKQLSLVVLSNFLFWFPVGIMGLMSLGGLEVGSEVYAWTTVLLLPINSAANPVLYTIPALMERWEKFKHRDNRMLSTSA